MVFFYQGWKKGYDKDGVRDNIFEEDPTPQFNMQDNIFPVSRQVFLDVVLLCVGETVDPDEVKFHKAPDDWVDPAPNTAKG